MFRLAVSGLLVTVVASTPLAAQQGGRTQQTELKVVKTDYDMAKLVAAPSLSPTELEGRRVYLQKCLTCHERSAPWLDQATLAKDGEQTFREKTLKGSRNMPGFQYALQPAELDQMIAYLKTVTANQKPRPAAPRR